jgi:hypothetical protein
MEFKRIIAISVYLFGIIFTIVGIVFDWFNFCDLRQNQKNIAKTEIES